LGEANHNLAAPWRVCMMLVFASPRDFRSQPLPIPIFFSSDISRLFQSSAKFGRKVTHLTKNFRLIFRPIFGRLERASMLFRTLTACRRHSHHGIFLQASISTTTNMSGLSSEATSRLTKNTATTCARGLLEGSVWDHLGTSRAGIISCP
jgi:hypothetical protein